MQWSTFVKYYRVLEADQRERHLYVWPIKGCWQQEKECAVGKELIKKQLVIVFTSLGWFVGLVQDLYPEKNFFMFVWHRISADLLKPFSGSGFSFDDVNQSDYVFSNRLLSSLGLTGSGCCAEVEFTSQNQEVSVRIWPSFFFFLCSIILLINTYLIGVSLPIFLPNACPTWS